MLDADIFNKFTKHLKNALKIAGLLAKQQNYKSVEPIHLLQGIMNQPGSLAAEILHKNGLKQQPAAFDQAQESTTITLELNQAAQKIITKMLNLAFSYHHLYVGTEHLLMALLTSPDEKVTELFHDRNIAINKLRDHVETVLHSTSHFSDLTDVFSDMMGGLNDRTESANAARDKSLLDLFTVDLTAAETQKQIDPVIGRTDEINRVIQILARRHKNNPLLLGDPGVGKTAIVEGLAKKIMAGDVPPALLGKKILSLDLGLMLAGTMYRGEFESRLKNILQEIKENPDIIIFIDELHNIIGAGSTTGGTLDAANLIKPALARGEIRCIGATTQGEYHKYIESDPALERRFQSIQVEEPTARETTEILRGLKKYYEEYHHVEISDAALDTAVDLAIRFIPDKFLPDKAIDLIDEAASREKISQKNDPILREQLALERKLKELEEEKNAAIFEEKYDAAIAIKNREQETRKQLARLRQKQQQKKTKLPQLGPENIVGIVSQMTHIPLTYLSQTGDKKLKDLEKNLNKSIIGQPEAITALVAILKRAQLGLHHPQRPIGSFLFLGPSGVGKTELAKSLAREYFGSEEALIRIDMSEFSESFNISKLIGAPAGYVGYREGGKITDTVRKKPYSVILFDEIEKGHPDVFNLLLQILDEGYVTDAEGRRINFRHAIIILTSNLASDKFNLENDFGFSQDKKNTKYSPDQIKQQVVAELENEFRPELINRLDKIIVFNPLDANALKKIVKLQIDEVNERLARKQLWLQIDNKVYQYIAKTSYAPNKGAREIRRNIENLIEQPLAEIILKKKTKQQYRITVVKDRLVIEPATAVDD